MRYSNLFLIFLSTILTLLFIYIGFIFYNFINYNEKENKFFKNKEILEFHKKYSSILNHTRGTDSSAIFDLLIDNHKLTAKDLAEESNSKITDKKEILFNYIYKANKKKVILLQGDSWVEQFNYYKKSKGELVKFGIRNNINIINAGTSSYSPTLMKLQFNILRDDFKIKPEIVVAMFDQTDIGDEICRYKNNRVFKNNKLISIKPAFHEFPIKWKLTELYFEEKNILFKSKSISDFKIELFFIKAKNKLSKFFNKNIKYCRYQDIQSYLIDLDNKDKKYFSDSIEEYLENLTKEKYIKKVILITFPHKFHFNINDNKNTKYNFDVSKITKKIVKNFDIVEHINFSEILNLKTDNTNNIWLENDISSHLKPEYHHKLITKEIIKSLNY